MTLKNLLRPAPCVTHPLTGAWEVLVKINGRKPRTPYIRIITVSFRQYGHG